MKEKIVWEKWIDPFLSNIDEIALPDDDDDDGGYQDSYTRAENSKVKKNYSGPIMVGPMGIIPLNEHNTPSKVYCFWMGHTNFNLSPEVINKIKVVPGVESLDVFTRYRFRVAFGKAFLDPDKPQGGDIMRAIEAAIVHKEEEQKPVKTNSIAVDRLKVYLKNKHKYWAIYKMSDEQLIFDYADSQEEVAKHIEENKDSRVLVATSWE